MTVPFILLTLVAYFLGALPVSYLAAKRARGIDLREYGTGQVGAGNLWRMTASWKVGLPVGIFDLGKGMLMVWVARLVGLELAQGVVIGLATIIGHNWSVFLGFGGGRGIGTALGLLIILPLANGLGPWAILTFLAVAVVVLLIFRNGSPLPVLAGMAAVPLASWRLYPSAALTLGFLVLLFIIIIKRLAPRQAPVVSTSKRELLLNRLFFDRDIRDRKAWMYRRPAGQEETKGP